MLDLSTGDSRLVVELDEQVVERITDVVFRQMMPAVSEIAYDENIPTPGYIDIILPEYAYEIVDVVIRGRRIPPPHCTLYLRCYREWYDILAEVPELREVELFERDLTTDSEEEPTK